MAGFLIATSYGNKAVPNYFFALARELTCRGHRVTVIVDGQPEIPPREGPVELIAWPSKRPTHLRDALFLRNWLRRHRPECVVANFGATNWCLLVGWWCGVPHRLAWYHTLSTQIDADTRLPRWKLQLLRRRARWVYRFATGIVANSEAARSDVSRVFGVPPTRCSVLPLLIGEPAPTTTEKNPHLVVCVGRFHPSKGQHTLVRALPFIQAVVPGVTVEFIGEGPERQCCSSLAESLGVGHCCRFRGALPLPEVLARMAAAAICVSPSRAEAFGLVNVEAQSVGTPVVASNVGGIRDIVRDGETGLLVPPDDPPALARAILRLLLDDPLREAFGARAIEHFQHSFSLRNISGHAALLENLSMNDEPAGIAGRPIPQPQSPRP